MKVKLYFGLLLIFLLGCVDSKKETPNAQNIVDKAIEVSGKKKLTYSKLKFRFRGISYTSEGKCNHYIYERQIIKKDTLIKDIYNTQKRLSRFVNDTLQTIADSTAFKYAESLNSINYFIQLPYRLNDEAVKKTYIGVDTIKGKEYHNIKVAFSEDNGGTDFQDVYYYWFEKDSYKLDYLAYSFVVNGGGIRFREAINERVLQGIRFVDYKNYKPKTDKITLDNISKAYENGNLELLSEIKNKIESLDVQDEC
jgi:hypothetical protein